MFSNSSYVFCEICNDESAELKTPAKRNGVVLTDSRKRGVPRNGTRFRRTVVRHRMETKMKLDYLCYLSTPSCKPTPCFQVRNIFLHSKES